MSSLRFRLIRSACCCSAVSLLWILSSCSSSSKKIKGVPAKLPDIPIHGSSATPSHSMPRGEYPFDSGGNYVSAWAAEGERAAGRSAHPATDYSSWRSSHGGSGASRSGRTTSSSSSRKTASSGSKKATGRSTKHLIRKGDTLSGIARKYGTTVAKIKAANGLKSDLIREGRTLTIPR